MEYVFLLVSVFVVYVLIYNMGRYFYTRKELVRIYKEDNLFLILQIIYWVYYGIFFICYVMRV